MRHVQYSPIQTDINDLFFKILNAAENVESLENTRDYGETLVHKNSNIKYAKELYKKYWKYSKGILKIYKLPNDIRDEIASRFSWLESIGEEPKISLQIISGGAVCVPHKDEERFSSILISVNDSVSQTEFYDEKIVEDQLFPNPDNIFPFATVRFSKGENWLFNHKSVHSVQLNQAKRITVSIGFNTIDYDTLCNFVNRYKYELV
jgi:hypothetical protein